MSSFVVALLVSIGASTWLYYKFFARRAGDGNAKPAIIGTTVIGLILFLILYLTLSQYL